MLRRGRFQIWGRNAAEGRSIPLLYRVARRGLQPLLRWSYRIDVQGYEHLPDRPAILAANHRSFMDSVFIAHSAWQPVAFLAKAEYFERPLSRRLMAGLGQIPLHRGSPTSARRALFAACEALKAGWSAAIYPEGTRSRDGHLHRGNTGVARLACQAKAPIVPIGIVGSEAVQKPGQRLPRLFKPVVLRFGAPIPPPDGNSPAELREVTDQVMAAISGLCEQEYDDRYAPIPAPASRPRGGPLAAALRPRLPEIVRFGPTL